MTEANYDEVICPNCVTQFRAIPVNVQNELRALTAQLETLRYEVDAIPAIKAERDAYEKCADTMAAAHKVERDALKAELARPESTVVSLMRAENAALKDAARLALDVCIEMRRYGNQRSVAMAIGAEAALKAVL